MALLRKESMRASIQMWSRVEREMTELSEK